MLRTAIATSRLLASRTAYRPFTTSSPAFVKIRTSKPPSPPSSQCSPAEKPPSVPDNISTPPPPFEPIVSSPSTSPHQTASSGPIEPPPNPASPEVPQVPEVPEEPVVFDKTKLPSLDIDPEAAAAIAEPSAEDQGKGKRTGAGRKEYVSSIERQRRTMFRLGMGVLLVGGLGTAWYLGNEDSGAAGSQADNSLGGRYERFKTNLSEVFDIFNKPAFKVLLPDPLPPPHQRPYTLVVDLEGLLVSSSWDRAHGWRTAKRPGLDYFLAYMSQFYEIVLFTSQPLYAAIGVSEKIDPWGAFIPYKLFRESTRYVDGKVIKDLSYLNRDLSKVILLDTNPEHSALQPENAVIIKSWSGAPGDQGLIDMIPFLEAIGIYNVKDVRPILQSYAGKDIPVEYAKKEAEEKKKVIEDWERQRASGAGSGQSWMSSMFGSVAAPGASRPNQPMTYLEQKRAFYQKAYQEEQKYWRDHADEFNQMVEEDKKRQAAEMRGSMMSWLPGGKKEAKVDGEGKI